MPPETVTSTIAKSQDDSLNVNVIIAVSPLLRAALLLVITTVGATVSMEIDGDSVVMALALPAVSVKASGTTETEPATVELVVGVKVAV